MSLFHSILSKIKERLDVNERSMGEIAQIVSSATGVVIKESDLSIKKGTLRVNVVPTIKMAILIKKEAILASFKEKHIAITVIS